MGREQKVSLGLLGVGGLLALVLSIQHVGASVFNPFTVSKAKFEQARVSINQLDPSQLQEEEAKRRDTDGDGLSDYDEQNVFQTSPYLRDSDGDGISDNAELAAGTNPNCATGKTCSSPAVDYSKLSSDTPFLGGKIENTGDQFYAALQEGVNAQKGILKQQGSTSTDLEAGLVRDPAAIRKLLTDSGQVDADVLKNITDEQLLQIYDQAASEAAQQKLQQTTGLSSTSSLPLPSQSEF